ncbi:piggyBac transposable element-derived protein 3-like [Tachysurus ichikawai]
MDSDDNDASDSENEVAGEMDKENHQPIDCPANEDVDIKPQPKKHTLLKKEFISPSTDFSGSEITNDATSLLTPLEYFQKETVSGTTCNLSHPGELTQHNTQGRATIFREDEHIHAERDIREPFGSSEETININRFESASQEVIVPPPLDVRKDMIAHIPVKTKRGRCRHCNNGYTNTLCHKCNVRLCFSDKKNCLWDYYCK